MHNPPPEEAELLTTCIPVSVALPWLTYTPPPWVVELLLYTRIPSRRKSPAL